MSLDSPPFIINHNAVHHLNVLDMARLGTTWQVCLVLRLVLSDMPLVMHNLTHAQHYRLTPDKLKSKFTRFLRLPFSPRTNPSQSQP